MSLKGLLFAPLSILCAAAAWAADAGPAEERCIVELESPSLVAAASEDPGAFPRLKGGRFDFGSVEVAAYLAALDGEHAAFAFGLAAAGGGAVVERTFRVLYNGAVVRGLSADDARGLPGVVRAVPADTVRFGMALEDVLDAIDVEVLWDAAGGEGAAGEGARIAVIDSGIDPLNPMFEPDGLGMPQGFPRGETAFTTRKVIAARSYFRESDPVDASVDSADAADHLGHGSRAAGIAAGRSGVVFDLDGTAYEAGGAAPRAHLMSYKVFYASASGESAASDAEVMAAFEDAVLDGADVISCSFGGPEPMLADTPSEIVFRAAGDAGAVVVLSAGNGGPGPGTVAYPGTLPGALTVGSHSIGRAFAGVAGVVGPEPVPSALRGMPAVRGTISPAFADAPIGPVPLVSARAAAAGGDALGCGPFPGAAFAGAVALVERGECLFSLKVGNAEAAGAIAVIVYNDEPGAPPVTMGGDPVAIPAVQIGNADGAMLEELAANREGLEIAIADTLAPYSRPGEAWTVSSFSARGPTGAPLLKPEIAAPGEAIVSATAYPEGASGPPWGIASGTSVAAPFAAGAAAVLRRLRPELAPGEVIDLIVSGASAGRAGSSGAAILDRGAGYLDLSGAAGTPLWAEPAAISFGAASPGEELAARVTVRGDEIGWPRVVEWSFADPGFVPEVEPASGDEITVGTPVELALAIPLATPGGERTGTLALRFGEGAAERRLEIPFHYRVVPPVRHDLLLVDLSFLDAQEEGLADAYGGLADAAGLDWDLHRVESAGAPELALLQGYEAVLAFTGDDQAGHLGAAGRRTLDALSAFLAGGGRVIVAGQGALRGSVHSRIFGFLGARIAGTYPLLDESTAQVVGLGDYDVRVAAELFPVGEAPADARIGIGPENGGAGDLSLVGEIEEAPGPGLTAPLARPAFLMDDGIFEGGTAALGAVSDAFPYYGEREELEALAHRAALLGFGLERVGDGAAAPIGSQELFEALVDWARARIEVAVEARTYGMHVVADAAASGGEAASFVFDFGDGEGALETGEPRAYHEYAEPGEYEIAVVARSTLGAAAVARDTVTVPGEEEPPDTDPGGGGGAVAGEAWPPRGTRDCGCAAVGARPPRGGSLVGRLLP